MTTNSQALEISFSSFHKCCVHNIWQFFFCVLVDWLLLKITTIKYISQGMPDILNLLSFIYAINLKLWYLDLQIMNFVFSQTWQLLPSHTCPGNLKFYNYNSREYIPYNAYITWRKTVYYFALTAINFTNF